MLKLSVIDAGAAKRLWARRMLDAYQLIAHKSEMHHTVYLDTPAFTLTQAQVMLAIHVFNQSKQTITYTAHATPSYSHPLVSQQWPSDILAALARLNVTAHSLVPMVQFVSKHHIRRLVDANVGDIAEMILCDGTIFVHGQLEPFCEIELVAHNDTTAAQLPRIAERIQQDIPSMVQPTTKLDRGWHLAQAPHITLAPDTMLRQHIAMLQGTQRSADEALFVPLVYDDTPHNRMLCACACQLLNTVPPDLEPFWLALDSTTQQQVTALVAQCDIPAYAIHGAALPLNQQLFSEGLRLQLRSQFRRMLIRRNDVLQQFEANHIHRMRVILRKIRALLECADDIYDDDALNQYKRGFRRMARFLGEVRDCDVLLEHMQRITGDTPVAPEVMRAITHTRTHALNALHELFNSIKHQQFIHEFALFVCTPQAATQHQAHALYSGDLLGQRIAERTADFQKPLPHPVERVEDAELHAWRIRGKRLRYILECFPSIITPETTPALDILDMTQQHLGILQDAVVAFELFNKMKIHTHPDSKKVIAQLRQEAQQHRQQLPQLWQACTGSPFNDAILATINAIR